MKNSFSKVLLTPLAMLVLTSFALAPIAEAQGRGGGGGGARAQAAGGVAPDRTFRLTTAGPTRARTMSEIPVSTT